MNPLPKHADDLLRILDLCLGDLSRDWSVSDVSKALELSMAKTSRTLNAIAEHGYLEKTVGNTYRVGRRILVISRAAEMANNLSIQRIERDAMASLQTGE